MFLHTTRADMSDLADVLEISCLRCARLEPARHDPGAIVPAHTDRY